jgi:DNA-3-methyladenine glycosylase
VRTARLPRSFYARPSTELAPDLLGRVLVRSLPDGSRASVRIVEVEAYEPDDPASHAFRGQTPRNATMFGPPGRLYVYFTYGMHFCMNAVARGAGEGSAVLLRAGEPLEGLDGMRGRRGREPVRELCSGPARLTQALAVGRELDGADLVEGDLIWIERPTRGGAVEAVGAGPRVGVHEVGRAWRFWLEGNAFVSRGRPGPPTARARASSPRVRSATR